MTTQVHVYVSPRLDEVRSWAAAFDGAIDLYRFSSNSEAYERLTASAAPVHVIILGCDCVDAFDLASTQLAQRLVSRPLESHPMLAQMQIVLVAPGGVVPSSPRIHVVSSHDAAVRLVKFGHVESAPEPSVNVGSGAGRPAEVPHSHENHSDFLAGSVISRIWDMADSAPSQQRQQRGPRVVGGGPRATQFDGRQAYSLDARNESVRFVQATRSSGKISTGHAPSAFDAIPAHGSAASGPLFTHAQTGDRQQAMAVAAAPVHQQTPGLDHANVSQALQQYMPQQAMPQQAMQHVVQQAAQQSQYALPEVHTVGGLVPAQRWSGRSGEYRGPVSLRASGAHSVGSDQVAQQHHGMYPQSQQVPTPAQTTMVPGVVQQVQQIIYPGQQPVGDPLLGFSAGVQQQLGGGQPAMLATTAAMSQQNDPIANQAGGMGDVSSALMARAEAGGVSYG